VHLQICASLQVCKFTPLQNLEIANFQFNKMQVHICKFASLQIYKIKKSKKLQFNNYNFITLQIASVHLRVHKFASLQN
jgi:hypothetical protein